MNFKALILKRPWLQLNEFQLTIAYYLLAVAFGGMLVLLQTAWQKTESMFVFATLQYPAEYMHSSGLIYILALIAVAIFRGRGFQAQRRLRYPFVLSLIVNFFVLGAMLWVFLRGGMARIFVMQDFHLVAVIFTACLALMMFDVLAVRARTPTPEKMNLILSIAIASLHVTTSVMVVVALINLELKQLNVGV